MASTFLNIILGLLLCAALALGGWLVYILIEDRKRGKEDLIINFDSRSTHGRAVGVIKNRVIGAGNREEIEFEPRDVDFDRLKERNIPFQNERIIVNPFLSFSFAKGTISADKNITVTFPRNSEEIHESVKNTPLGIALKFIVTEQNLLEQRIKILQTKIQNRDDLMDQIGDAEMTEEFIARMKGYVKDLTEMMLDAKEAKRKSDSTFTPPTQHHG